MRPRHAYGPKKGLFMTNEELKDFVHKNDFGRVVEDAIRKAVSYTIVYFIVMVIFASIAFVYGWV